MRRSPVATVAIVALLLTSMVALPLGTGLAIAQGPPDHSGAPEHAGPPDHAGVPTDNINVDRRGSSAGGPPADVSAWGVSASRHSETLGVEVRLVDGELEELVLDDDVNHAGREVAVDVTALVAALPDVSTVDDLPDRVYGEHETEGRWSRPLVVRDGYAMLEVPHFSTNTISFSEYFELSAVSINQTEFTYDTETGEKIRDLTLNVSGKINTEESHSSKNILGSGNLTSLIGGNQDTVANITISSSNGDLDSTYTFDDVSTGYSAQYVQKERIKTIYTAQRAGRYDINATYGYMRVKRYSDILMYYRIYNSSTDSWSGYTRFEKYGSGGSNINTSLSFYLKEGDKIGIKHRLEDNDGSGRVKLQDTSYNISANFSSRIIQGSIDGSPFNQSVGADDNISKNIQVKAPTDIRIDITNTSGIRVKTSIKATERTKTVDPEITINSESGKQSVGYTGVLNKGESVDLSDNVDMSLISGETNLTVNLDDPESGPEAQALVYYRVDSNIQKTVEFNATSFAETYNVSKTYNKDKQNVRQSIPFTSDYIVGINDVTLIKSDGESRTVLDPSYKWDSESGELVVNVGSMSSGESSTVLVHASKVQVPSGEITVIDPSYPTQALDTRIRVDDVDSNGDVAIETTNLRQTAGVGRLAYVSSTSWTDGVAQSLTHLDDGKHTVRLNDPILGGTATLSTGRLGADALSGDAYIKVIDMAEPRFRIEPGEETGGVVEVVDYDSLDGATYDLYRVSDGVVADTSVAGSSLSFRTGDKEGVYTIRTSDSSGAFAIAATASGSASSSWSGIPDWLLLLLGVSASIALLILSSSRVRPGSFGRLRSGSTVALGVGTVAILFVAVELLTDYSLVGSVTERGLRILGESTRSVTGSLSAVFIDPLTGTFGALVATIGLVLGVIALEQRTRLSVPLPVTIGVSGLAVVWLFESIAPGSVLGPLTSGLSEVGAAVWILGILSAVGVIYLWLRSRRPEIVIGGSS